MEIRRLEPDTIDDRVLGQLVDLVNRVDPERLAEDPPHTADHVRLELAIDSPYYHIETWGGFVAETLVGICQVIATVSPEEPPECEVMATVHPDHRRRGHGTRLLDHACDQARSFGRTVLQPWAALDDDARAFYETQGYDLGYDERVSRLYLDEVDDALLDRWIERAGQRAGGYHLVRWSDHCPDEWTEQYCAVLDGMNDAPMEDLHHTDTTHDLARMRGHEEDLRTLGHFLHVILAVETATGEAAGYTAFHIRPTRPFHALQGDTNTLAAHRERGLGRWMKAEMLRWMRQAHPEVRFADTGNADSNEPMLAINEELGFRPIAHYGVWQRP